MPSQVISDFLGGSIQLCNVTSRLSDLLPLTLSLKLRQLLLALFSGTINDAFFHAEHTTLPQLLDHHFGLFHGQLAKDLVHLVQRLRFQRLLKLRGEGLKDLAGLNLNRLLTVWLREIDGDFCVGVNGMQLDLLDTRGVVGGRAILAQLSRTALYAVVCLIDVVTEQA